MDGFTFLLAVVALVLASTAHRRASRLEEELQRERLLRLELSRQVRAAPAAPPPVAATASVATASPEVAAPPAAAPPPLPTMSAEAAASPVVAPPPPPLPRQEPDGVPMPPPVPVPDAESGSSPSWEQFVGARLFAWLGGIALFLGAAFALQWSIQQGLIPAWLRVASGFAVAIGLVVGGWRMRVRDGATATAASLLGAGLLVGYGTSFAAHGLYDLAWYGPGVLFAVNALIAASGAWLADRLVSRTAAWLGVIGAFSTPGVLWRADLSQTALDAFALLLLAASLALAHRRGWLGVGLVAALLQALQTVVGSFHDPWTAPVPTVLVSLVATGLVLVLPRILGESDLDDPPTAWSIFVGIVVGAAVLRLGGANSSQAVSVLGTLVAIELALGAARMAGGLLPAAVILPRAAFAGMALLAMDERWEHVVPVLVVVGLLRDAVAAGMVRRGEPASVPAAWADTLMIFGLLAFGAMGGSQDHQSVLMGGAILFASGLAVADVAPGARRSTVMLAAWGLVGWCCMGGLVEAEVFLGIVAVAMAVGIGFSLRWLRLDPLSTQAWVLGSLAGPVHYFLARPVLLERFPEIHAGVWPLLVAGLYAGLLARVAAILPASVPGRASLLGWFGGTLAAFVALAVPDFLGDEARLAAWAVQGAALAVLGRARPEPWLRWTGGLLLAGVAVAMLGRDLGGLAGRGDAFLVGSWVPVHLAVIAALVLGGRAAGGWPCGVDGEACAARLRDLFFAAAALLGFVALHLALDDAFAPRPARLDLFSVHGFAHGMAITLLWAVSGLVAIVIGLRAGLRPLRVVGFVLLLASLAKLFLHDMAGLGALPRIGAFMGVAVLSLLASWLFQRLSRPESD